MVTGVENRIRKGIAGGSSKWPPCATYRALFGDAFGIPKTRFVSAVSSPGMLGLSKTTPCDEYWVVIEGPQRLHEPPGTLSKLMVVHPLVKFDASIMLA